MHTQRSALGAILVSIGIALVPLTAAARSPLADSTDIRIVNEDERENSVAVSPLNPNVVLVSNNAGGSVSGWISMNAGRSWARTSQTVGEGTGDPACVISKAITPYGRFVVNHLGPVASQAASYKDHPDSSWTEVTIYDGEDLTDKNHLWVDNKSTGSYANRMYCGWSYGWGGGIKISKSTNNGTSWSAPVDIEFVTGGIEERWAVNINSNSNGTAYAVWANNQDVEENLAKSLGFSKSTNGGQAWSTEVIIQTNLYGFGSLLGNKHMMVTTYPSMTVDLSTNHIYVVWASKVSSGDSESDIYLIKSTDGGSTWSPKKRVNQDQSGNGKDQWFPWITWDECTGALAVVYLDSRAFANNNSAHTYVSVSFDTSATWQDFRVSDDFWAADVGGGLPAGYDYIGIASGDGRAYPVWSDDRQSGNMRPYVSPFYLWGVYQSSVQDSIVGLTADSIRVTASWSTNLPASGGDYITLYPPGGGTPLTSPACTTCGDTAHTQSFTARCQQLGTWTYTVKSTRSGCSARTSDPKSFYQWVVYQDSVTASIVGVPEESLTVTASWATSASATAGDYIVLRVHSSEWPYNWTTYTSPPCTTCGGANGKTHEMSFTVPCQAG